MTAKTNHFLLSIIFLGFVLIKLPQNVNAQDLEAIQLLPPDLTRGTLLMQALKNRQSNRDFSPQELPLDVLSHLLWAASGVNRPESGRLTAPTATDSREITVYAAMKTGLYRYDPGAHRLDPVLAQDIRKQTGNQAFTQVAPVDLIYVGDFSKMRGDAAFYTAADTGFISQNVYLFCASEGLATVVLGWIDKPALEKTMGLPENQKVILTQPVGYPK